MWGKNPRVSEASVSCTGHWPAQRVCITNSQGLNSLYTLQQKCFSPFQESHMFFKCAKMIQILLLKVRAAFKSDASCGDQFHQLKVHVSLTIFLLFGGSDVTV